ncbi:hypothetical protein B0T16DRAFT_390003 [Cercophora newfieldiana]|uniref:Uncharacterized protein n=1 Tax=Cercophora newfieldiana TaxID=92897 RepID=A0AA40CQ03_9PEZI|nr:hypothetical protein B0T16DRAFT_390003 [Cercophora newfieldiana]
MPSNAFGAVFGRFFRSSEYEKAQADANAETQDRIFGVLEALREHLTKYIQHLDSMIATFSYRFLDSEKKEILKRWDLLKLAELEEGRKKCWLDFWLVYINDDASALDRMPSTREQVLEALECGKAKVFDKHGTVASLLDEEVSSPEPFIPRDLR